ncbi:hypothetical protein Z043_124701, partial [Scleropages formosus]
MSSWNQSSGPRCLKTKLCRTCVCLSSISPCLREVQLDLGVGPKRILFLARPSSRDAEPNTPQVRTDRLAFGRLRRAARFAKLSRARPGKDQAPDRCPKMEGGMQLLNRDGHSISHNSKRHYHDSFVSMSRMRQRGLLCDIVLHVASKEIKAHKVVLASCSPYFHAMFTNEMSESRQTHVTLHDIDPQALEQLVQYAYTAEIVVGEGNVQ